MHFLTSTSLHPSGRDSCPRVTGQPDTGRPAQAGKMGSIYQPFLLTALRGGHLTPRRAPPGTESTIRAVGRQVS